LISFHIFVSYQYVSLSPFLRSYFHLQYLLLAYNISVVFSR
jgi:hypothetical protein